MSSEELATDSTKSQLVPETPLLYGQITDSPLDLVVKRLFFIIPLNQGQIRWLNTVVYHDSYILINYWSLTHILVGMLWGLLFLYRPNFFTIGRLLLWHTFFEIWELWAGGYFTGKNQFIWSEWADTVLDTVFVVVGVLIVIALAYAK